MPVCSNAAGGVYKPGPVHRLAGLWDRAWLLLPLAALFWSGNVIIGRALAGHVPPITLACLRWCVALALLTPFSWRRVWHDRFVLRASWRIMLLLSLTGIAIQNTLVYYGLTSTVALNGLLFQSITPLLVLVWAYALFGERPSGRQTAGLLVSLVGVAVIVTQGMLAHLVHLHINGGDGFILAGMADYALYAVLLRRRPAVHPLSFLTVTFALGASMLLPAVAIEQAHDPVMHVTGITVAAVLFVAVFPALLAYLFFNRGVELIGGARAGQSLHLVPMFGSLLAVAFLGEQPRWYQAGGIALIAAGLVLAQTRRRVRQPSPG